MKKDSVFEEKRKGFLIRIVQDDDAENPFGNDDGLPDIISFHKRYNFNTRKEDQGKDPESFLDEAKANGYLFRPLFMLDHSGLAFSLRDFCDKWDSGQLGFIFWTPEKRELIGTTDSYIDSILKDGETRESWLVEQLESAVRVLNLYHSGQTYGYVVEDQNGEHVDSCWGYLCDLAEEEGGPIQAAQSFVDHLAMNEITTQENIIRKAQAECLVLFAELESKTDSDFPAMTLAAREKVHALAREESQAKVRLTELQEQPTT